MNNHQDNRNFGLADAPKVGYLSPYYFFKPFSLNVLVVVRTTFLFTVSLFSILIYIYSNNNFVRVISAVQAIICLTVFCILILSWYRVKFQKNQYLLVNYNQFISESQYFEHPIIKNSPVGMATINASGKITHFNQTFIKMLGINAIELIDNPFHEFFSADDAKKLQTCLSKSQMNSMSEPVDLTIRSQSNRMVSIYVGDIIVNQFDKSDNKILHMIDISAFKELENQIIQSRKMQAIGQLAGGIAHDFNNLLTAMLGFCDLLLVRHRVGDDSFSDLMQIKQNANRASTLVKQLLAFSRQQTLRPRVLSVELTLEELSHLLRRLIGQSIELKLINAQNLGLVRVDLGQFEQVIVNLAVNARDAMPNGGKLTIRTSNCKIREKITLAHETMPPGHYVQIDVIDTGIGINDEVVGRIFDPFFTTKPVGQGTGLGLSTVWGIVRQTGGYITVKSEINRGTSFTIFLPRYTGNEVAEKRSVENVDNILKQEKSANLSSILLVEDEDAVRMITSRALRNQGYHVIEAQSGEIALKTIESRANPKIDMLITDAVMPVIDGPSLIRQIRMIYPLIKVICISGHTDESLRQRLNEVGQVRFIAKPFSLQQLLAEIREQIIEHHNINA